MNNKKPKLSKYYIATAKRLLKYVTETYKARFILVFVCIFLSAVASISVSLSLKYMLDDFILPLIGQKSPDYTEFYRALAVLGCIFIVGVIATFIYTRMMVYIGQGVLKRVRDDMFEHMQTLPIRYFDQNTNGSIMSLYTNDTDTLRQMISQAIPQGTDVVFHHHCYIYFHAGLKSPADTACHCCHRDSGICHKKNRWKQWKILCAPAGFPCRRDRICGRTYEWPACGKSVQP